MTNGRIRRTMRWLAVAVALAGVQATVAQFDFAPPIVVELDRPHFATCVAAGDLDGDGLVDLVVSGRNSAGEIAVLRGIPSGFFAPPEFVFVGHQSSWVTLGDLDGDAVLDVVLSARGFGGRVVTLRGQGDGTFDPPRAVRLGREVSGHVLVDADGDGDLDVAACNLYRHSVSVLTNDGAGGLTETAEVSVQWGLRVNARPWSIDAGDLTGDGIDDLVVTHLASGHLSVLPGDGAGGFGPARRIIVGSPVNVRLHDVDGDGALDVTMPSWNETIAELAIFAGDGTGTLDRTNVVTPVTYAWHLELADLDGDGRRDAVLTEALNGLMWIFGNDSEPGAPSFTGFDFEPTGDFARHVLPLDLDDDCDLDLIVADISSHDLRFYLNETPQSGCAATDLDGDGRPGYGDLLAVLAAFGTPDRRADLDHDGVVGVGDLLRVTGAWR